MTKVFLGNAFSLQMLNGDATVKVTKIDSKDVDPNAISVVGHADTAAILKVPMNRASIKLDKGDVLLVAQLTGGRLPEGSTTLPDGFSFDFLKVEIL